jgi:hypothetical protein
MTATPSRPKPRPMNKESAAVDNFPLFLASAAARSASSGKQYLALPAALAIIKVAANLQMGASDCFASQFCNFEFSESRRRALVRSSALCARQWQLWPPLGPFPLKFAPRAQTPNTTFKVVVNFLFTISSECHNVLHEFFINLVHCLVYWDNGFQICMPNFV